MELEQPCSCALNACEVKLAKVIGGEDPMFIEVDKHELISFGSR